MKPDEVRKHIERAAIRFDAELHTQAYEKMHADPVQLRRLLAFLSPRDKEVLLDLGTGSGYVGMALAKANPACSVIGLDVSEKAIKQDVENANHQGVRNVDFRFFDGVTLPFGDSYFDGAVCRYALHHFPRSETTLREIARTLRSRGKFVLADPVRDEEDEADFINRFQELRGDGHVRIFRFGEFMELVSRQDFELIDWFSSSISFQRPRSREYDELLAAMPTRVQSAYALEIDEEEIRLTFRIVNAVFRNQK